MVAQAYHAKHGGRLKQEDSSLNPASITQLGLGI